MCDRYSRRLAVLGETSIDVAAVAHGEHQDEEDLVPDLVDDPVVTGAYAPLVVAANELLGTGGPRLLRQEFDRRLDASTGGRIVPA